MQSSNSLPTQIGNVRILSVPHVGMREPLNRFVEILQDAVPYVMSDVMSMRGIYDHTPWDKWRKRLTSFDLRVLPSDGVIRLPRTPIGISFGYGMSTAHRVSSGIEVTSNFWGKTKYTIHALALHEHVPRKAIVHQLVEHMWPSLMHDDEEVRPIWARIREDLSEEIDFITELRTDIPSNKTVCACCDREM